ncbi:MAG: DedA family protein [Bacteroidota bacterium]
MEFISQFFDQFHKITDSNYIIQVGGLALITAIVYAESGIFFCFFLPGDYLLFSAGIFCGTGDLNVSIWMLVTCLFSAAFLGNYTGFFFGRYLGHTLTERKDSFFFKKKYLDNTRQAFDRYGGRALVVGRFLPIIRTFAPILAGIVRLPAWPFFFYNVLGALLWVVLLAVSGFYLGDHYKQDILKYLPYIIACFIGFTSITVINSWLKIRRDAKKDALAQADKTPTV